MFEHELLNLTQGCPKLVFFSNTADKGHLEIVIKRLIGKYSSDACAVTQSYTGTQNKWNTPISYLALGNKCTGYPNGWPHGAPPRQEKREEEKREERSIGPGLF